MLRSLLLFCPWPIAAMLAVLWLTLSALAVAAKDDGGVYIGINRTNIAWADADVRKQTIAAMGKHGVRVLRLDWREPRDNMRDVLGLAKEQNISVLLIMPMTLVVGRSGANNRPGFRNFGPRARLSDIDVQKFGRYFAEAIRDIKRSGVHVIAFQIGNEINWADFNGDLPLQPRGVMWSRIEDMPDDVRVPFEKGLDIYTSVIRTARRLRDQDAAVSDVPIITAGLADLSPRWISSSVGTGLSSSVILQRLQRLGAIAQADGIGLHAYNAFGKGADTREALKDRLAICGSGIVLGRACWITEYGARVPPASCDLDDAVRLRQITDVAHVMETMGEKVAGAFYYDWDQDKDWALFRCGQLTKAGEELLELAKSFGRR
jgi:hypothetical protein